MKKEIFTSVAALATALFLSQPVTAQDDAAPAGQAQQAERPDSGSAEPAAGRNAQQGQAGRSGQQPRAGQSQNMDQKFVEFASTNDQFEIQAAQLAEQQAEDDQIKQMARMIRQDHQQSSKQLQQISQQAGVQVSQQLKPYQQAILQELKQMQGQEFDRAWLYGNIAGHTKAVLKFRDASREAQNPQIKQFAQQALPKLQKHLQHAQQMAQFEEAQTAGASERGSGASDRSSDRPGAPDDAGTPGRRPGARPGSGSGTPGAPGAPGASGSSTDRSATDQSDVRQDTGSGASSDSASGGRSPSR